jgi:linoleoyl-CoA desaturase
VDSQLADSYDELVETVWRGALPTDREIRLARRRLHRKALAIAALFAVSYTVLVLSSAGLVIRLLAAAALVLALVTTGTSIMHDANHGSFARHRWVNRTLAYTSDALGASSWLWRIQHNRLHHGNTNVVGFDADLELAPWARLAPTQTWHRRYRFQHLYIWPLYGFMTIKNVLVSDVLSLVHGRIGQQPLQRRVTLGVLTRFVAGKVGHLTWAVAVPLMFNPWQAVLAFYVVCSWAVGFVLALIFQLAHCVEASDMSGIDAPRRGEHHAAHQLRTTVDIACRMPVGRHVFRWIAGGLDHQIEHHLAPGLPHTIYPQIATRFRAACARNGLSYHLHPSLSAAIGSHTRWLRAMGAQVVGSPSSAASRSGASSLR